MSLAGNAVRQIIVAVKRRKAKRVARASGVRIPAGLSFEDCAVFEEIFIDRVYAPAFPFHRDGVIVDCGAHKGYFSLFAHLNAGAGARIIAIEPVNSNIAALESLMKLNGVGNVERVKRAVHARRQTIEIYRGTDVNFSAVPTYNSGLYGMRTEVVERVETMTLGDIFETREIDKIDFFKLDCEGVEYEILLDSAFSSVAPNITTISLEYHDRKTAGLSGLELYRALRAAGYEVLRFDTDRTDRNINGGKIVATRL